MPTPPQFLLFFLPFLLLLSACRPSSTTQPTATPQSPIANRQSPTSTIPPTATLPAPPTLTPRPTDTPTPQSPIATLQSPTPDPSPTPTITPTSGPMHTPVTQPPYAPSQCSDKYPCNDDIAAWEARIRVPPGFQATYFAYLPDDSTAEGITSLTFGPDGRLYVAHQNGTIYTVDETGRFEPYLDGFNVPTGLAFEPATGRLFISDRVLNQNSGGESQVSVIENGRPRQLFGNIPCCYTLLHAANGIAFGPDGYGYVTVGARADHGEILDTNTQDELHPWEATILRFDPNDPTNVQPYAYGLRNSYDLTWDANGRLFATDNAPDFGAPDELHRITPGGQHGYPWYDCNVCFPAPPDVDLIPPIFEFPPHAAATGITTYLHDQFPGYYNNLFVTLWSAFPAAQKIIRFSPNAEESADFATGFAAPIDLTVAPDGSLYVADWATGIIFKITYVGL